MPFSLTASVQSELFIKKSRFIGRVESVKNREEAQTIVDTLWFEHPNATHICWAMIANGQAAAVDDGEPGGTAGRPMLEVLRHHDLDGVLATVVRYFGGVKLGTGGLVRAYTDAIAQALMSAELTKRIDRIAIICQIAYAAEGRIRYFLEQKKIVLQNVEHNINVTMYFEIPKEEESHIYKALLDISQGVIQWNKAPSNTTL